MPFRVQTADDVAVITLTVRCLDDMTAEAAGERLLRLADEQGRHRLCLDLGELPYLTSMWLGKLVALHQKVRSRGGRLILVNVPAPVYEVFSVTQLDRVLDIRPQGAG
jgi:anti-sigma B factor antagonist